MASTAETLSNFIDGERAARRGRDRSRCSTPPPARRSRGRRVSSAEDVDRAVERRAARVRGWSQTTPGRSAPRRCSRSPTRSRSTARRSRAWRRSTPASRSRPSRATRSPVMADNLRFFAGAARCLEGRAAGEYMEGYTSFTRREAGRRDRPDHALELPADDGDLEDRPGARGRQHGRAQARRDDARSRPCASPSWPPTSCRRACSTWSPGPGDPTGQALLEHPDVDMVSLTGSVDTGKHIARTAADTLKRVHLELGGKAPVVVFDDVEPRERAGDDRRHRLLQRRPGLHGRDPRAGRGRRLRRRRRGARRAGARAS